MFSNTLFKTIYIKRWMTLAWSLGLMALIVFTMIFFPSLSKSFSEALTNVPESLKTFIGDANTYKTVAGYIDVQIITQYAFMTLVFGIVLFTGLIAGEENEGTLQTLLVQPVQRGKIYLEKFLSAMILLGVVCFGITLGVVVGLAVIDERIGIIRLLIATLALWLITLVFSTIGFVLGAITGKRGLAGGLAGVLAFVSLLVTSLASSVHALEIADKLSPFHYFNKPGILQYGPRWGDMVILLGISVVMVWIGIIFFKKRDIYQR